MKEKLKALKEQISEEVDLLLYDEATSCFRAGAYRAAYIMIWITAAESLHNKFSVMAARRDGQAGDIMRKVEDLEKEDSPTDIYLLQQSRKLGLVTEEQHTKLAHVRTMRNLYAHPRRTGPTEQEVLASLEIVVDAVLSQPPLLRHGYVNELLSYLFDDRHFLEDEEKVVHAYAADVASRVHPGVWPYLLTGLVKRSEEIIGDPERSKEHRRARWFVAGLISELEPDLSEEHWDIVSIIQERPAVATILLGVPEVWPFLPSQAKGMILGHLTEPLGGKTGRYISAELGLRQARVLASRELLAPRQLDIFRAAISAASYRALKEAGIPLTEYVERLLADLKSRNWDKQNPVAALLGDVGACEISRLDPDTQERLGRNVLQAAEGRAWQAQRLIAFVSQHPDAWPKRFIAGLLFETLFDDSGRFRLKGFRLQRVLEIALSHEKTEDIINETTERVRSSEPKDDLVLYDLYEHAEDAYEETIVLLDIVKETTLRPDLVDQLVSAVRSAKPMDR